MTLSYASGLADSPLLGDTIGACFDQAVEAAGDRDALVDFPTGRRWTYRELAAEVDAVALGLRELAVGKGDRVGSEGGSGDHAGALRGAPGGRRRRHPWCAGRSAAGDQPPRRVRRHGTALRISELLGATTDSLRGLDVKHGSGLGGKAIAGRPHAARGRCTGRPGRTAPLRNSRPARRRGQRRTWCDQDC